jgi:integrase/recombinase XerD
MGQVMVAHREHLSEAESQAIAQFKAGSDPDKNPAIAYLGSFKNESLAVAVSRARWVLRIAGLTDTEFADIHTYRATADKTKGRVPRVKLAKLMWENVPLRLSVFSMDWSKIDRVFMNQVSEILLADLAMSASHVSGVFSVMKGISTQSWEYELINERQFHRVIKTKNPTREWKPKERYVGKEEVTAILTIAANQGDLKALRDSALVSVLYSCGLRRREASGMCIEDIDTRKKGIRIFGKRDKERWVYPPDPVWGRLLEWISEGLFIDEADIRLQDVSDQDRRAKFSIDGMGTARPVFVRMRRGDNVLKEERLTTRGIEIICSYLTERADLERVTPHDFRAAFISRMLEEGHDLSMVSSLAGHKKVDTTAGYDRRKDEKRKEAFRSFTVDGL